MNIDVTKLGVLQDSLALFYCDPSCGVVVFIHMICALCSQCVGLGAVWPLKTYCSAGLFSHSAGLFLLTFFTFCYSSLLFLLLVSFVSYFLLLKGVRFVIFCYFLLLLVILINYFLPLKRAKVYILFIARQGKGCTLIFFLFFFLLLRGKGWRLMFFFSLDIWKGGRRRGERG